MYVCTDGKSFTFSIFVPIVETESGVCGAAFDLFGGTIKTRSNFVFADGASHDIIGRRDGSVAPAVFLGTGTPLNPHDDDDDDGFNEGSDSLSGCDCIFPKSIIFGCCEFACSVTPLPTNNHD